MPLDRWQHSNWLQACHKEYRAGHMFGVKIMWREIRARIISAPSLFHPFSVEIFPGHGKNLVNRVAF